MKKALVTAWMLILTVASVLAQVTPTVPLEDTYLLQPDDVLRIQVYNEPQATAEVVVGRDGNISAPFVGTIRAAGRTTAQLEEILAQRYTERLRLRDPKVSVLVIRYRPVRATVVGMVRNPGVFEMRPGDTVLTLLGQAGGYIEDGRADLRRARLRRAGTQEWIPIDLYAMLMQNDLTQNYRLQDGDELNVPEETINRILVFGAVPRPGVIPYKEPMTVADAIAQAGHEIRYRSWFSRTLVIRRRPGGMPEEVERIQVDMVRYFKNGDWTQNIQLKPGDMVYVPETKTPDLDRLGSVVNSILFFDSILRRGFFPF